MGKITEAKDLPEGEKVYLKKDFLGWRVVEPYKDMETGKINKFNLLLGGKRNIAILIILLLIFGGLMYGFNEKITEYKTVAQRPCDFCDDCNKKYNPDEIQLNITKLTDG